MLNVSTFTATYLGAPPLQTEVYLLQGRNSLFYYSWQMRRMLVFSYAKQDKAAIVAWSKMRALT